MTTAHEVVEALGTLDSLDSAFDPIQKMIRSLLQSSGSFRDFLHGVWLGHPLHPVLTDIPVGAWTVAAVLDAAELTTGSSLAAPGADAAIAIGLAGAVGSAITGLADWSETDYGPKRIGAIHGSLNVVAASLYATSLVMRGKKSSRTSAIGLAMFGYGLTALSAYLGGHLVFGEQVGVDHTATADSGEPADFTAAIAAAELRDGAAVRVVVCGVPICLVKHGDRIRAIGDTCPHLGGPLCDGEVGRDSVRCPWHGSEFALDDGAVLCGPAAAPARSYDVRIRGGQVELRARHRSPAS